MKQQNQDSGHLESLKRWAAARFPEYRLMPKMLGGKYGLVLLFEAISKDSIPYRFAAKMVRPESLPLERGPEYMALFEREIGLWLRVPQHTHVLPALSIALVELAEHGAVPAVLMSYADDTLESWTSPDKRPSLVLRLAALAEACHGLQWLRAHGVEGHGDLKPDNILLVNRFERRLRLLASTRLRSRMGEHLERGRPREGDLARVAPLSGSGATRRQVCAGGQRRILAWRHRRGAARRLPSGGRPQAHDRGPQRHARSLDRRRLDEVGTGRSEGARRSRDAVAPRPHRICAAQPERGAPQSRGSHARLRRRGFPSWARSRSVAHVCR